MFTQCPECGTVFRVTASVLRAAQGQVRCGVCDANFDALRYLSDAADADGTGSTPAADRTPTPTSAPPTSLARIPPPAPATASEQPPVASAAPKRPAAQRETPAGTEHELPLEAPPAIREPPVAVPTSPQSSAAATRTRPSIDEDRALAEIAAALARDARVPEPPVAEDVSAAEQAPDLEEANVLEPADVEDIVLETTRPEADEIPDSALEFNLPPTEWDRVFIEDRDSPTITPLDLDLAPLDPPAAGDSPAAALDLDLELELEVEPTAAAVPRPAANAGRDDPLATTDEYAALRLAEGEPVAARDRGAGDDPAGDLQGVDTWFVPEPPAAQPRTAAAARPRVTTVAPAPAGAAVYAADRALVDQTLAELDDGADRRRPWLGPALAAGAALLALTLVLQIVHHSRESLADNALIGRPLASLYAGLGIPVEPRWDLGAYDVKQWGAASDNAPGALRLRASVVNRSSRSQPFPLLRVTLEDRFGGKVARREFAPAEYLPGRAAPQRLLAPGARADADLSLADPGSQAVGFELDVCLKRRGILVCGSEAKSTGGG